ncbi:hypothetical protein [Crassaminicella profunda]|uniref:hypothetical protein n=1 Tax=Crassaminicella profunda TaxID=1286698 RepID=UPI001CA75D04|nr:hypothetical protein [Crassaminicella profunda]QZY56995.1 hypothetical protein K7H06_08780 [Crassaminicella profunda]
MKIRLHFPHTLEKQKLLSERIAQEHVNMIKEYINKLSIDEEDKYRLWEDVKLQIKKV